MHAIVADSAYKTPYICKCIFDDGQVLSTAYQRPQTLEDGHEWYDYIYDVYFMHRIPEYRVLHYATSMREGNREYKSRSYICMGCPTIHKCTHSKKCEKVVTQHIWKLYRISRGCASHFLLQSSLQKAQRKKSSTSLLIPRQNKR